MLSSAAKLSARLIRLKWTRRGKHVKHGHAEREQETMMCGCNSPTKQNTMTGAQLKAAAEGKAQSTKQQIRQRQSLQTKTVSSQSSSSKTAAAA